MGFLSHKELIRDVAESYGYDPALLAAQAARESGFNPKALSPAGARGLMQFMPKTWAWAQTMGWATPGASPEEPLESLRAGLNFMRWLMNRYKDHASPVELALAAYNAGPGAVEKAVKATNRGDWEGVKARLPKETQDYVPAILGKLAHYRAFYGASKAILPGLALLLLLTLTLVRRFA